MRYVYIGLDIATVTGIAIYLPENNKSKVVQYKGTPTQLLGFLQRHIVWGYGNYKRVFVLEEPHHFRNATTTKSLLERYGFIKYSLINHVILPVEVNLNSVRSYFRAKTKDEVHSYFLPMYQGKKKFTDNHSDALAVAIYQAVQDGHEYYPPTFKIMEMETA